MRKTNYLYCAFMVTSVLALASLALFISTHTVVTWKEHNVFMQSVEGCDVQQ